MPTSKQCGELGEIAFMHRAATLGLRVSQPFGDSDRYDMIVDNGERLWRMQIKTTSNLRGRRSYLVNCGRRVKKPGQKSTVAVPYTAAEIDFLAIYIIPEEAWYIMPVQALAGRVSMGITPQRGNRAPYGPYAEAWNLLQPGVCGEGRCPTCGRF